MDDRVALTLHSLGVPYAFASHDEWWRVLDER